MSITLKNTVKLLARCFMKAENQLRERIALDFPGAVEEQITTILQDRVAKVLRSTSRGREFETVFAADIQNAIGYISGIEQFASGLIAKVSWHPRKTEEKTGGDLGLAIIQPLISDWGNRIELIREGSAHGLVCQAKRKTFKGSWGFLEENQMNAITKGHHYFSILRYEYLNSKNSTLKEFIWTLCKDHTANQVAHWLAQNSFPNEYRTEEIIEKLGFGQIGTPDPKVIEELITPEKSQILVVKIDWDDGFDPKSAVYTINNARADLQTKSLVYIKN
jgi:hypothetical protein